MKKVSRVQSWAGEGSFLFLKTAILFFSKFNKKKDALKPKQNFLPQPGVELGPLNWESSALSTRPPGLLRFLGSFTCPYYSLTCLSVNTQ